MRHQRQLLLQKNSLTIHLSILLSLCALFCLIENAHSQPKQPNNEPTPQTSDGRTLAADLCNQRPGQDFSTSGLFKTRDPQGRRLQQYVSLKTSTSTNSTNSWQAIYEAGPSAAQITSKLTITHHTDAPNQYLLALSGENGLLSDPTTVTPSQTMIPFAGTEFWMTDLGMDFFHWPQQKIIKREMRKSRPCKVLESTNPNPSAGSYARVLSWIDNETGGLLRAEAYDASRKLLKEFSLRSFSKINGHWELKEIEIRNTLTDATTRLEFDLEIPEQ